MKMKSRVNSLIKNVILILSFHLTSWLSDAYEKKIKTLRLTDFHVVEQFL